MEVGDLIYQPNMTPPEPDYDEPTPLESRELWVRFDESGVPLETRIVETIEALDRLEARWGNARYASVKVGPFIEGTADIEYELPRAV